MEPNPYEAPREMADAAPAQSPRISRAGLILIALMVCGTSLVILDLLFMKYMASRGHDAHKSRQTVSPLP